MKNHVIPQNFRNFETNAMVTLENDVPEFETGGGVIALKVIKCKFWSSYAPRKHFKHHVRSKLSQGHQRSSSANFQKSVSLNFYAWKRHC